MNPTLILIRHAHRDTTDRAADNGLSRKGAQQARAILKRYVKMFGAIPKPLILSSPKLRCRETVEEIASFTESRVKERKDLLEQGASESEEMFQARVAGFVQAWVEEPASRLTIVCSHGDWLPLALEMATGAQAEFKKGAWACIELSGDRPRLFELLQSPGKIK
jgi:broad specificity phosphatase PhoE